MTWKELFSEFFQHVLGNSVILMIVSLTIIAIVAMVRLNDVTAMKDVVLNVVSAIAGAAGGAGITAAVLARRNGGTPQAPPGEVKPKEGT